MDSVSHLNSHYFCAPKKQQEKKTDSNQTYNKYDKILTIKKVDIDEEISLGN